VVTQRQRETGWVPPRSSGRRVPALAAVAVIGACLVPAGAAAAARTPTPTERRGITAAVERHYRGFNDKFRPCRLRVSSFDATWAAGEMCTRPGVRDFQIERYLLRGKGRRWRVVGTNHVGSACDHAPTDLDFRCD
jgi:hypothetical protein